MSSIVASKRTAADYMTRKLIVVRPDLDLFRAMRALLTNDISGVPVVDGQGDLVGILTEKDCFRAAYEASYHRDLAGPVSDYMSHPVETAPADTDIVSVIEWFHQSRFRRLPIVEDNRLIGILARRDILRALEELW
jgi:CBS domain-containing protein